MMPTQPESPDPPPAELSRAGAVVDKAIEYMVGQGVGELAIASALLGGSLALLSHSMADESILRILDNAIASVRAGELRRGPAEGSSGDGSRAADEPAG
jgi:hypothetical protein